jgi:hypothetical protein
LPHALARGGPSGLAGLLGGAAGLLLGGLDRGGEVTVGLVLDRPRLALGLGEDLAHARTRIRGDTLDSLGAPRHLRTAVPSVHRAPC